MSEVELTINLITLVAAFALPAAFAAGMLTMHAWLWHRITKWRG